ncbi:MAG TPA: hypothetical protein VGI65_20420 [Steroidobacteraceae bacterium]|jgi:hypothetical protein
MLRLAKAFLEIALWKKTPAHLPASPFLLALAAGIAALLEVLNAFLPANHRDGILPGILLSVALPVCFAWAVLVLAKRKQRFVQTASALLGVEVLAELVIYPVIAALRIFGSDRLMSNPIGLVLYAAYIVGVIWYLLACAHIWRSALDTGLLLGGVISVGYFVFSAVLEFQFAPPP